MLAHVRKHTGMVPGKLWKIQSCVAFLYLSFTASNIDMENIIRALHVELC